MVKEYFSIILVLDNIHNIVHVPSIGPGLQAGFLSPIWASESAKTTTAYAIANWLKTNYDKEVYTLNFNNGIEIKNGLEKFWRSI
ncbi:hypothetical protein RhiirC2_775217 [Rhizophagus irregularis]|uniref:Uncharacterized protein n=1 Tax=Rhizophagus irregularis TaxID=588596 RepID=A0A2N1NJK8_9GLOM|nr:hypothetical protein RhiirC2_775217 [Rhizophagus irregularis]